jgi:putative hydrolase of HD superfamily
MIHDLDTIVEFARTIGSLKRLERYKGQVFWRDYPFPQRYESVADHSWQVAMLIPLVEPSLAQPLHTARALKLALIHDLPEALIGDWSPLGTDGTGMDSHAYNYIAAQQKDQAEWEAIRTLVSPLPLPIREELIDLWAEFAEQATFESRVVKALDKIEGKLQMLQYTEGHMYKEHFDFSVSYGIEACQCDPALAEWMNFVVQKMKQVYHEFIPDSYRHRG